LKPSKTKAKLAAGERIIGTMVTESHHPDVARALAGAGLDFMFIDTEHCPYDMETVHTLCQAARRWGIDPIVRVPDTAYHLMCRPLDAGAVGLMVPRVETREQAQEIAECVFFPPRGRRGCAMRPVTMDYQPMPVADYVQAANEQLVLVIQIESQRALDHLDDILRVEGPDVALVGPCDLSISLGVPGQSGHPKMLAALDQVAGACERHGLAAGIHAGDLATLGEAAARGFRWLTFSSDGGFLAAGARTALEQIQKL